MPFSIKVLDNLTKNLEQIIDKTQDQTKPLKQAGQIMQREVMKHFSDQMGSEGLWKSLSPVTLYRRRHGPKKSLGTKILMDSGDLRKSLNSFFSDKKEALVGTDLSYAPIHQYGLNGLAKRDFLWLSPRAEEQILLVFAMHNLGV